MQGASTSPPRVGSVSQESAAGLDQANGARSLGFYRGDGVRSLSAGDGGDVLADALAHVRQSVTLLGPSKPGEGLALGVNGETVLGAPPKSGEHGVHPRPALAWSAPLGPQDLGDPSFRRDHGLRYAWVAGAMANGIASVELTEAMARAGMLGFFGAAGLGPAVVEDAIHRLDTRLGERAWGSNLIHSPYEAELEREIVDLYLRRGVRLVSASAYLRLTLPLVRYRVLGIARDEEGLPVARHRIFGKVSRHEVARQFLEPPPEDMLRELIARGEIDEERAQLASSLPMADELSVEADSGGHTDNRPAIALLPVMIALRDRIASERGYRRVPRVGLGGGISTPWSAQAAFSMGAAYVLVGTVHQACREAGTSDVVRQMLAEAEQADVAMAPAADMFEMGVDLQVLKRGTMFAMRARRLRELYESHEALEAIPHDERQRLERQIFRMSIDEVWAETESFWRERDPRQLERAARDSRHRMALVFRWYLGQSSRWANTGAAGREADYQVWCGPAMGAFNEWVRGTWLEDWQARRAPQVALAVLHSAAVLARYNTLALCGAALPEIDLRPRPPAELEALENG